MSKQWNESTATAKGLYDPRYEHDNCGIGAVVNLIPLIFTTAPIPQLSCS